MYSEGHWGIGMLLYAPLVLLILVVDASLWPYLLLGIAVIAFGSTIPDIDMKLKDHLPIRHRGITHTVWFSVVVGLFVAGISFGLGWYAQGVLTGQFSVTKANVYFGTVFFGLLGVYSTLTHFVGDIITPTGLKPFEPLSDRRYRYVMTVFGQKSKAANGYWNRALYIIGTGTVIAAFILGTPQIRGFIFDAFSYLL